MTLFLSYNFITLHYFSWASLVAQMLKNLPAMQETQVQSLGQEDPLEKGMATHSNILAWRIPWAEEPGRLSDWHLFTKCQITKLLAVSRITVTPNCIAHSDLTYHIEYCFYFSQHQHCPNIDLLCTKTAFLCWSKLIVQGLRI